MHPALKSSLDVFELRSHPLWRSDSPYGEGFGLVPLPTVVGKAQEVEGLRFSLVHRYYGTVRLLQHVRVRSVPGFFDYAGPDSHSRVTQLPFCLPTHDMQSAS